MTEQKNLSTKKDEIVKEDQILFNKFFNMLKLETKGKKVVKKKKTIQREIHKFLKKLANIGSHTEDKELYKYSFEKIFAWETILKVHFNDMTEFEVSRSKS